MFSHEGVPGPTAEQCASSTSTAAPTQQPLFSSSGDIKDADVGPSLGGLKTAEARERLKRERMTTDRVNAPYSAV